MKRMDQGGRIDFEMLKNHVDVLTRPVYYIAGPPGMGGAMFKALSRAGSCEPRVEQIAGY